MAHPQDTPPHAMGPPATEAPSEGPPEEENEPPVEDPDAPGRGIVDDDEPAEPNEPA